MYITQGLIYALCSGTEETCSLLRSREHSSNQCREIWFLCMYLSVDTNLARGRWLHIHFVHVFSKCVRVILKGAKHKTFYGRGFHDETNTSSVVFPLLLLPAFLKTQLFIHDLADSQASQCFRYLTHDFNRLLQHYWRGVASISLVKRHPHSLLV